jgi:GntR family transcriptional regulator
VNSSNILTQINIDKNSPVPIYHQLREGIKALIIKGKLKPNDRVPSENGFSDLFAISPMTVRQALSGLVEDGFVYRERGRGTFVSPHYKKHPDLTSFSEDMLSRGFKPSSQILEFERVQPSNMVADALQIHPSELVIRIRRIRLANGRPVGIHTTHIRGNIDISRKELERTDSLYRLFGEKNIRLVGGLDELQAISANEELSNLLDIATGEPLLRLNRITEDETGKPIEYVQAIYRADFYRYTTYLK